MSIAEYEIFMRATGIGTWNYPVPGLKQGAFPLCCRRPLFRIMKAFYKSFEKQVAELFPQDCKRDFNIIRPVRFICGVFYKEGLLTLR